MKIFRRLSSLILLVRLLRRLVTAVERLALLYETDLRERQCPHCGWGNSVVIPNPDLVGQKEAAVEVAYGSRPSEEVENYKSFEDMLR